MMVLIDGVDMRSLIAYLTPFFISLSSAFLACLIYNIIDNKRKHNSQLSIIKYVCNTLLENKADTTEINKALLLKLLDSTISSSCLIIDYKDGHGLLYKINEISTIVNEITDSTTELTIDDVNSLTDILNSFIR